MKKVFGCGGLIVLLIFAIMVGAALNSNSSQKSPHNAFDPSKGVAREREGEKLSQAKYAQLQPGMTYDECVQLLGMQGNETASSTIPGFGTTSATTSQVYIWKDDSFMGGTITGTFSNGKLLSKAQFGLK